MAEYIISSGDLESGIILENDSMTVLDGGIATETTVNSSGQLFVSSGGMTNSTTVTRNGSMFAFSGGMVNNTILSGGNLEVMNGAQVNNTALDNEYSVLFVSSGGTANNITLKKGTVGICGTATIADWTPGEGYLNVYEGATVSFTNEYYGVYFGSSHSLRMDDQELGGDSWMYVMSGGIANNTLVPSHGCLYVFSEGTAFSTTINDKSGRMYVFDKGVASDTYVMRGGSTFICSGGIACDTVVNDGYMFVGGTAIRTTIINSRGNIMYVSSGGTANDTTVNFNGWLRVDSGGTANSTTVNSGGTLFVDSGGITNCTTVNSGGWLRVYSGGTADSTVIRDRGSMFVSGGGTASCTIVNSYGWLDVSSGGTAIDIVENGGYVSVAEGAVATFVSNSFSGLVLYNTSATVHSGTTANSAAAGGKLCIFSGGKLTGRLYCLDGTISAYDGAVVNFDLTQTTTNEEALITNLDCIQGTPQYTLTVNADQAEGTYLLTAGASSFDQTIVVENAEGEDIGVLTTGETIDIAGVSYKLILSDDTLSVKIGESETPSPYTSNGLLVRDQESIESGEVFHDTLIASGGGLHISSGGTADSTTIIANGSMIVSNGGTADSTTIIANGSMIVSSGGTANNTTVNAGGRLSVSSGGIADYTTINSRGKLHISSGGTATEIIENGGSVDVAEGANVTFVSISFSGLNLSYFSATVHSGTTATSTTVNQKGYLAVFSGGTANNTTVNDGKLTISSGGTANSTTVNSPHGSMFVSSGGTANNTTVNDGGCLDVCEGGTANNTTVNYNCGIFVSSGGTANSTTVNSGGRIGEKGKECNGVISNTIVYSGGIVNHCSGGKLTGKMTFESGARVLMEGAILDFDLTQVEAGEAALVNDLSIIQGVPTYTLTVDADSWKPGSYVYALADGAENFASTISVVNTAGGELGVLMVGETVRIGYDDYTLNLNEGALTVTVEVPDLPPTNLVGTADGVTWDATGADHYALEYSMDGFAHVLEVVTMGAAVDTLNLPAGTYQWRVKDADGEDWAVGEAFASENEPGAAKVVRSNADGADDLFFANACGVWEADYVAQHGGSIGDWSGTLEYAGVSGKNKLADIFEGSDDANILLLTDDSNGDGLFVDDIYTELPGTLEEQQARIARIDEIRAGAGDDIIDMTSQRFEYIGDGILICGGDGNDVLWANKGDNTLFGDAGNDRIVGASGDDVIVGGIGDDRMHGGGGDDVFAFCENWGADTVEQLATGSVTLWFASGDLANWDADSLTYTDSDNSVTVKGVTAEQVTLKFGDDGSAQYDELLSAGAFAEFTSRKIFEEATLA